VDAEPLRGGVVHQQIRGVVVSKAGGSVGRGGKKGRLWGLVGEGRISFRTGG